MTFETAFDIGQKVIVDDDKSMVFTIVGVAWFVRGTEYSLGWVSNGDLRQTNIDEFRLSPA